LRTGFTFPGRITVTGVGFLIADAV